MCSILISSLHDWILFAFVLTWFLNILNLYISDRGPMWCDKGYARLKALSCFELPRECLMKENHFVCALFMLANKNLGHHLLWPHQSGLGKVPRWHLKSTMSAGWRSWFRSSGGGGCLLSHLLENTKEADSTLFYAFFMWHLTLGFYSGLVTEFDNECPGRLTFSSVNFNHSSPVNET